MLDLLATASTLDTTEEGETNGVVADPVAQEEKGKPAVKRKRVSVAKPKAAKKVAKNGIYLDGRPTPDMVTPAECKAPCPLLNSFLSSLPDPTSTPVPDLLQVCFHSYCI
jgi:hypothetical protein